MRITHDRVERMQGRSRNIMFREGGQPGCRVTRFQVFAHFAIKLFCMSGSRKKRGNARITLEALRLAHECEERFPVTIGVNDGAQMAIASGIRPALAGQGASVSGRPLLWLEAVATNMIPQGELDHGL